MGERGLGTEPARSDDIDAMSALLEEAMAAGALGFSTSRTFLHRVPDGRPVPGTHAAADELLAFADVLGRAGTGVFEGAMRLGERDDEQLSNTRAEIAWMGEASRRSGRPISFGLTYSDRRPDLYRRVIEFCRDENASGACIRPQTTARGIGILFGLESRTPFDGVPVWQELRAATNGRKMQLIRDAAFRQRLIADADVHGTKVDLAKLYVLPPDGPARYDCPPEHIAGRDRRRTVASVRRRRSSSCCSRPTVRSTATCRSSTRTSARSRRCSTTRSSRSVSPTRAPTSARSWTPASRRSCSATGCRSGSAGRSRKRSAASPPTPPTCSGSSVGAGCASARSPTSTSSTSMRSSCISPSTCTTCRVGQGGTCSAPAGYEYTLVNGEVFMERGEHAGPFAGRLLRSGV